MALPPRNHLSEEDKKLLAIVLHNQFLDRDSREFIKQLSKDGLEWLIKYEDMVLGEE